MLSSDTTTNGVRVQALANYLLEESNPLEARFFFFYNIKIFNENEYPIHLLSRYWCIINADGEQREVRGDGVIGKQPIIQPSQYFEYTSGCPLSTEWGTMEGFYRVSASKTIFQVHIGRFYLTTTRRITEMVKRNYFPF